MKHGPTPGSTRKNVPHVQLPLLLAQRAARAAEVRHAAASEGSGVVSRGRHEMGARHGDTRQAWQPLASSHALVCLPPRCLPVAAVAAALGPQAKRVADVAARVLGHAALQAEEGEEAVAAAGATAAAAAEGGVSTQLRSPQTLSTTRPRQTGGPASCRPVPQAHPPLPIPTQCWHTL